MPGAQLHRRRQGKPLHLRLAALKEMRRYRRDRVVKFKIPDNAEKCTKCTNGRILRDPVSQAENTVGGPGNRKVDLGPCGTCKGTGYVEKKGK